MASGRRVGLESPLAQEVHRVLASISRRYRTIEGRKTALICVGYVPALFIVSHARSRHDLWLPHDLLNRRKFSPDGLCPPATRVGQAELKVHTAGDVEGNQPNIAQQQSPERSHSGPCWDVQPSPLMCGTLDCHPKFFKPKQTCP